MTKPIRPQDVSEAPAPSFPPEVFDAFNSLIREKYRNGEARFTFREAAARVASLLEITVSSVYREKYLDVEEAYRKAGWKVVMDKPGYNESYEGFWVFSRSR